MTDDRSLKVEIEAFSFRTRAFCSCIYVKGGVVMVV